MQIEYVYKRDEMSNANRAVKAFQSRMGTDILLWTQPAHSEVKVAVSRAAHQWPLMTGCQY